MSVKASRRRSGRWGTALTSVFSVILLAGCGIQVPTDPGGSLERISGGEIRVGVSIEPELSQVGDTPSGPLPTLAEQFAQSLDASTTWHIASEESLVRLLQQGEIDLAFGHFTADTAWSDGIAISRPFTIDADGHTLELVAFLQGGENALLSEFESFNDEVGRSV